ncbi:MAG TPA: transposase [Kineosporiaceae bacterium]
MRKHPDTTTVPSTVAHLDHLAPLDSLKASGRRPVRRQRAPQPRAVWDADAVAAVARWILERLNGPAMLAVDETGDAKSSTDSVGAAQQYSRALGGVGCCQVAEHLSLATPGRACRDRAQPVPG